MINNGAILSDCGQYRYALWRTLTEPEQLGYYEEGTGKIVGYFGVNPSTADHTIDDQTVMKWRGFSLRIPHFTVVKFVVGNLAAYRSTDVNNLKKALDPIGEDNDLWIDKIISRCDVLIPCWGNKSKLPKELRYRVDVVEGKLRQSGKPVLCFGKTLSGCPRHPLMLGYDTPIVRYFD